jgi:hypothetical protein
MMVSEGEFCVYCFTKLGAAARFFLFEQNADESIALYSKSSDNSATELAFRLSLELFTDFCGKSVYKRLPKLVADNFLSLGGLPTFWPKF